MSNNNFFLKALFLIPPFSDFYISRDRLYPINVVHVSRQLMKLGISITVSDLRFGEINRVKIPQKISYLKDFYKKDYSKFSLFNDYKNFGITEKKDRIDFFKKFVENYGKPDFILITSNFTAFRSHAINLIHSISEFFGDSVYILFGGNDVIINEKWYKDKIYDILRSKNLSFDKIIIYNDFDLGRLKIIIKKLIKNNFKNISNDSNYKDLKSYKKEIDGSFYEDTISLSNRIVRYYFIDKIIYYNPKDKIIIEKRPKDLYIKGGIILSNGCPYRCSYCFHSIKKFQNFSYRKKIEILKDLLALKEEGFETIHIEDDSFSAQKESAISILKLLSYFNKKFHKFCYEFPNGLNYHKIDEQIIKYFKKTNVKRISVSLGTQDDMILKNENRPSNKNQFIDFIKRLNKREIDVIAYIIAGIPGQTFLEIVNSLFFLFENKLKIGFSPYYPVVNSEDYVRNKFNIADEIFFASSSLVKLQNCLSLSEKATLFKLYRILSFIGSKIKEDSNWLKKIFIQFEHIIKFNNIDIEKLISNSQGSFSINIDTDIHHTFSNYLEIIILSIFFKYKKIYIANQVLKENDIKIKFELFPCDIKIDQFHERLKKIII